MIFFGAQTLAEINWAAQEMMINAKTSPAWRTETRLHDQAICCKYFVILGG
jgi:hypothetical protein